MPDKPFFAYFAPGPPTPPTTSPRSGSDKYRGRFDAGWDALRRRDLRPAEGAGSASRRCRAHRTSRGDPGLGRHARRAEAGARPSDGGLRRLPRAHRPSRRPADRRPRGARDPRRHPGLLHHRRQRGQRRGDAATARSTRLLVFNRSMDLETAEFLTAHIDEFGTPDGQQPLRRRLGPRHVHALPVDQAGGLALRRHPQRDDRPLARRVRAPRARSAPSSTTSSTSPRPSSTWPGIPEPTFVNGIQQMPLARRRAWPTASTTPRRRPRETQYFEMVCNRGIYHKGWTAVTRHSIPWLCRRETPAARRRRLGALRHQHRLDPGPRPGAEHPEKLVELQRLFLIEAVKYGVLPAR